MQRQNPPGVRVSARLVDAIQRSGNGNKRLLRWINGRVWVSVLLFLLLCGAGLFAAVVVQGTRQSIPVPDGSVLELVETKGEALYQEAVALLERKDLSDFKIVVDELKASFSRTSVVSNSQHKPSFARFEQSVASRWFSFTAEITTTGR